uniref:OSJNBa0019K04.11 protein n=1 Tax=Oryza sativa subsp. japonica TaxID=39947 RepID=Q7XTY6_ORYSJ|nr:OSJNBa0019K04.11 [Oryza sativa Japonica Group]
MSGTEGDWTRTVFVLESESSFTQNRSSRDSTGLQRLQSNQTNQSNEEIGPDFLGGGGLGHELQAVEARLGVVIVQVPASSTRAGSGEEAASTGEGAAATLLCRGGGSRGRRHPHRWETHGGSSGGALTGSVEEANFLRGAEELVKRRGS